MDKMGGGGSQDVRIYGKLSGEDILLSSEKASRIRNKIQ